GRRAGRPPRSLAAVALRAPAQRLPGGQAAGRRRLLFVAGGLPAGRISRPAAGPATPAGDGGAVTAGRIINGSEIPDLSSVEVDFVVVGSGAGGATAAAVLTAAGAQVALLEEGGHDTRRDFNMQESWAYPALYQEHGNRATDDLSILILQGRSVGGGTTVNWTSSFRTPDRTLALWAARHGVRELDAETLAPHFA